MKKLLHRNNLLKIGFAVKKVPIEKVPGDISEIKWKPTEKIVDNKNNEKDIPNIIKNIFLIFIIKLLLTIFNL